TWWRTRPSSARWARARPAPLLPRASLLPVRSEGRSMGGERRCPLLLAALLTAAVVLLDRPAGAEIFVYTDASGVQHFTNTPGGDGRHYRRYRGDAETPRRGANVGRARAPRDQSVARFTRYDPWIVEVAALYQVPEALIRAIIRCESDFDPRASCSSCRRRQSGSRSETFWTRGTTSLEACACFASSRTSFTGT